MRAKFAWKALFVASACACPLVLSCMTATQMMVEFRTDIPEAEYGDAIVNVAETFTEAVNQMRDNRADVFTMPWRAGTLGTLAVVPKPGGSSGVIVVRAARKGKNPYNCLPPDYKDCVVARRKFVFGAHESRAFSIFLYNECLNVPCSDAKVAESDLTCSSGKACVDPTIECASGTCDISTKVKQPGGDGGIQTPTDGGPNVPPDGGNVPGDSSVTKTYHVFVTTLTYTNPSLVQTDVDSVCASEAAPLGGNRVFKAYYTGTSATPTPPWQIMKKPATGVWVWPGQTHEVAIEYQGLSSGNTGGLSGTPVDASGAELTKAPQPSVWIGYNTGTKQTQGNARAYIPSLVDDPNAQILSIKSHFYCFEQ